MKYYFDTEFHEYEKHSGIFNKTKTPTIDLISIGIVSEDEREYYAVYKDFDVKAAWKNEWLRENVLSLIFVELWLIERGLDPKLITAKSVIETVKKKMTKKFMKKLLLKYGKSRVEIAEEIKRFVSIKSGYSNFSHRASSRVILWVERNEFVEKEIQRLGITEIFEGDPEFYAYYADYDWVVFCWLFGRMIDLPKGFPKYCIDLKQVMDEKANKFSRSDFFTAFDFKNLGLSDLTLSEKVEHLKLHTNYPTQQNEHNALSDAKWNKELGEFLNNL